MRHTENVGWAVGSEQMQAEGIADKKKGEMEIEAARNVQFAKGTGEQTKGTLTEGAGKLFGDESLQAQGKSDRIKGETRKEFNS